MGEYGDQMIQGFLKGLAIPDLQIKEIMQKAGAHYKQKYERTIHMFDNITIIKSPNADSRSATGEFSLDSLTASTERHISDVRRGLELFANFLNLAGDNHDFTKMAYMEEFYDTLINNKPGEEVKASKWYQMHITRERHHLLSKAPDDINLIDVLEQIVDCVMAGMARSGELYDTELPDELLQKAYKNTVELLKSRVKVVEE